MAAPSSMTVLASIIIISKLELSWARNSKLSLRSSGFEMERFLALWKWLCIMDSSKGLQLRPVRPLESAKGVVPQKQDPLPVYDNGAKIAVCKAGNDKCESLRPPSETGRLPTMPCDICCGEPHFCGDCCCLLCCRSISLEHRGYSYVKCEALVSEDYICGHVAHLECALRAHMAGTIGGIGIGLDAEYCCMRCDTKKDLVPHVSRFLEICQTMKNQDDVEKILSLGICILRSSQRENAKELLNCIEATVTKAKMQKLEEEIGVVLKSLREAQESVYEIAQGRLQAQKECLDDLYRQLEKEKSELSSGTDANSLMKTLDQIRKEVAKFREMGETAKGFGRGSVL